MNATLRRKTVKDKEEQTWRVVDGADIVLCWLDSDGFHSQRYSPRPDSNGKITHAVETVRWSDMIMKAEGQLKLL